MSDYSDDEDAYNPYESDDELVMDDDDDELPAVLNSSREKSKAPSLRVPFESFTPEKLRERIDKDVEEMASLLGVSRDLSLILFMHFRWNRDRLIDKYSDAQTTVLKEVGELSEGEDESDTAPLPPPSSSLSPPNGYHQTPTPASSAASTPLKLSTSKSLKVGLRSKAASVLTSPLRKRPRRETAQEVENRPSAPASVSPDASPSNLCGVCFDTLREEEDEDIDAEGSVGLSLHCKHRFCEDCWTSYLSCKVQDEAHCAIRCMEVKCPTFVPETILRKLLGNSDEVMQRYEVLLAESYVGAHPTLRFCPFPSCDAVVHCPSAPRGSSILLSKVPTVVCCGRSSKPRYSSSADDSSAGHTSCFGCGVTGGHEPVICKIAELWLGAAREDAGTSQWIKANTRTCPKCSNNIEKAGGCNRMVCRHCRYQFCWMCMKSWDVHGYNNSVCNAFVEPPRTSTMDEAKANLERWLFYYDRFNNHEVSAKLEVDLVKRTEEKMTEIQQASCLSWIETHFMQSAVEELSRCRQTLKWTYAMAHFLVKDNHKQMFEDIQADLEKAVEQLSQMLDESIEEDTVMDLRRKVLDKTVYVAKRHEVVLEDVARGLDNGDWQWTVSID